MKNMKENCAEFLAKWISICALALAASYCGAQSGKQLGISDGHVAEILADGTVREYGALQTGTTVPRIVPGLSDVVAIALGGSILPDTVALCGTSPLQTGATTFSLALKADGTVWSWGFNQCGQLGRPTISGAASYVATPISGLVNIVSIAAGTTHALAADSAGRIYGWGGNNSGQVGASLRSAFGPMKMVTTPTLIYGDPMQTTGSYSVHAAAEWSGAFRADIDRVMVWGRSGGLRTNATSPLAAFSPHVQYDGTGTVWMALGADQLVVKLRSGEVFTPSVEQVTRAGAFLPSDAPNSTSKLAAGVRGSVALTQDGRVFTHGQRAFGQTGIFYSDSLALLNPSYQSTFEAVSLPEPAIDVEMSTSFGLSASAVVAKGISGQLYAWGVALGTAADGNAGISVDPSLVPDLRDIVRIVASGSRNYAQDRLGRVYSWGGCDPSVARYGEQSCAKAALGGEPSNWDAPAGTNYCLATKTARTQPTIFDVVQRSGSGDGEIELFRTASGALWLWSACSDEAPRLAAARTFTSVSGMLALDVDGRVFAFGYNSSGQRGLGVSALLFAPVPVRSYTEGAEPPGAAALGARNVVEFFTSEIGPARERFFLSANPRNSAALDRLVSSSGSKAWLRTGRTFRAWPVNTNAPAAAVPVRRFYCLFSDNTPNTHFYTANPADVAALRQLNPLNATGAGCVDEGIEFQAIAPDFSAYTGASTMGRVGSSCPVGHQPVYRAFNNRAALKDGNHRMTTSWIDHIRAIRYLGFVDEGVVFCSPIANSPGGDLHAYVSYPGRETRSNLPIIAQYVFANNGPGHGNAAKISAILPEDVSWTLTCDSKLGATCPSLLTADVFRSGAEVAQFPAGGIVTITAEGRAPLVNSTASIELRFGAEIQPKYAMRWAEIPINQLPGAPDPYMNNNSTAVSVTIVKAALSANNSPSCSYGWLGERLALGPAATTGSLLMSVDAGCPLHLDSLTSSGNTAVPGWLTVSLPAVAASLTLNRIQITAVANTTNLSRSATVVVNGRSATIVQAAATPIQATVDCVSALAPLAEHISADGHFERYVSVSTSVANCAWHVKSESSWLNVRQNSAAVGAGGFSYAAEPNSSAQPRFGKLNVGNASISVYQEGLSAFSGEGGAGDGGGDGGGAGGSGGEGGSAG
jgi:alpha-tubulin suppressor-like RCC1 family protein